MVVGQEGKKFEGSHLDETMVVAKCAEEHLHELNQTSLVLEDASDVQRTAWIVA